jgi:hypothetical protein
MRGTKALAVLTGVVFVCLLCGYGCQHLLFKKQLSEDSILDPDLEWFGRNREELERFLWRYGDRFAHLENGPRRVAIFDWDNTVIKNDIGDAMMFWMLRNGKILIPPGNNWTMTSRYLTSPAKTFLTAACNTDFKQNDTRGVHDCTDAILTVYLDRKLPDGQSAFSGYNHHWMQPAYAWAVQLMAGYTRAELTAFADTVISEMLEAELGATQTVGTRESLPAYIRIYPQMADLIAGLDSRNFEIWVVSASAEAIVAPFAERVGIPPERVIGVRTLSDGGGRATYDLAGCGPVRDGENSLISYRKGKRCWINREIYDMPDSIGEDMLDIAAGQALFAAGDSETDLSFLQDTIVLRLVINRQKEELMCQAYHGYENGWIINPMFIDPLPTREGLYPCESTACLDVVGNPKSCLDSAGHVIPDQIDWVSSGGLVL